MKHTFFPKLALPLVLLTVLFLNACISIPPFSPERALALFDDTLFKMPAPEINGKDIFAMSEEMRQFIKKDIARQLVYKGTKQALFDALYTDGELKIDYDADTTKNAQEAFSARAGNCMSLVLMTAAFARELGLEVQFQSIKLRPSLSRNGNLLFRAGHVNVILLEPHTPTTFFKGVRPQMTIDFLSPEESRGLTAQVINENVVIAMYMNNRAAEYLAREETETAYWWARSAQKYNPELLSIYNTLGAIYKAHGDLSHAKAAFSFALELDPKDTSVAHNLAYTLNALTPPEAH